MAASATSDVSILEVFSSEIAYKDMHSKPRMRRRNLKTLSYDCNEKLAGQVSSVLRILIAIRDRLAIGNFNCKQRPSL
jgi:hypothetical protein